MAAPVQPIGQVLNNASYTMITIRRDPVSISSLDDLPVLAEEIQKDIRGELMNAVIPIVGLAEYPEGILLTINPITGSDRVNIGLSTGGATLNLDEVPTTNKNNIIGLLGGMYDLLHAWHKVYNPDVVRSEDANMDMSERKKNASDLYNLNTPPSDAKTPTAEE